MSRELHRGAADGVEMVLGRALDAAAGSGYPTCVVVVGGAGRDARIAVGGRSNDDQDVDQVVAMLRAAADRLEGASARWSALRAEEVPR